MATVNQVYTILNSIARQQYGTNAVTVVNTSTMIALGDTVMSTDKNRDAFFNELADRIGRTIFSVRRYEGDDQNVVKHSFEFGVALQKIYVDLPDAEVNNTWNIGETDYTPQFAPIRKPIVKQHLFSSLNTFEIGVTVPDNILKTAFINETEMAAFISAIFIAVENRLAVAMESMINLTRASFIARKLQTNSDCGAINLLAQYKAAFPGKEITVQGALYDPDFLKYASSQITLWTRRMRKMSTLFNDAGYKRHTPMNDVVLTVLDDFAATTSSYLQADTFHDELVSLPRFDTVPYWQGSGTSFSFTSLSTINVQIDENTTINRSGVIAVAYDYQALGAMINNQRTLTERNNHDEYTNYYHKVDRGLFNDMSENGIVFYIAEEDAA